MPKAQYINEGFTAGEISPDLRGRVSADLYKESVSTMQEMVATVQGAAIRRPGTRFIAEVNESNATFGHRLIPYKIGTKRGVMFHVGPDNVTAYDQNGPVTVTGAGVGTIINVNPYFNDQLTGWVERNFAIAPASVLIYNTSLADVSWDATRGAARFETFTYPQLNVYSSRAALAQNIILDPNTQYALAFTASSPTVPVAVSTPDTGGVVRVTEVSNIADYFPASASYATNILASLPFTIDKQTGSITFTTPAWGVPTQVRLEISLPIQGRGIVGAPFSVWGIQSYVTSLTVTKTGVPPGILSFVSPWIGKDTSLLSYAQTPEIPSKLLITHPDVTPQQIIYNPTTDAWSIGPIVFVGAPWSVGDFPGTVGIHSGRLILASSRLKPERIWFSKVLDYFNFTIGTLADSAFFGDLSEPGRVLWVRSMWSLVIGSESGLWDISPYSGAVIGPGNTKTFKHQAHHSSNSAPAFANNEVAYSAEGNRRMYSVRREGDENGYVDRELSFSARHISELGFGDTVWAEFPYNNLWSSVPEVGLGTLMGATYDPKLLTMAGWHRHNPGGQVQTVGAVSVGGIDRVFLLISRTRDDVTFLSLEILDWSMYLDSAVVRTVEVASTTVSNLSHLNGKSVYAVGSTNVIYGPYVVAAGVITISDPEVSVIVGIPFTSKIVTKRPEGISPGGTAQGLKKRWNKIFVRVSPGSRPIINGRRPPDRDPNTTMDRGQGADFEDVEVSSLGWSKDGYITIEEFLPLPMVIASIFGHVTSEIL